VRTLKSRIDSFITTLHKKNANKTYFVLQTFFVNKNLSKKPKVRIKNTIIDKTSTYASETCIITERDRKQMNVFDRKMYRRILGLTFDNEKENWRILTNKEIFAMVKKPTITETIKLNRLRWFEGV
jgi:endo-1,4-beta-mannosidase